MQPREVILFFSFPSFLYFKFKNAINTFVRFFLFAEYSDTWEYFYFKAFLLIETISGCSQAKPNLTIQKM